jgi:membrane fusion protein (multidrug efflux system)
MAQTAQESSGGRPAGDDHNRTDGGDGRDGDGHKQKKKPSIFSKWWVKLAIAGAALVLVVAAVIWWLIARQYEDTDDAFIDTHIVHIAPQIAGRILAVHVNDNQTVRPGTPLVDIDARDEDAKLAQALAQRVQAVTQVTQARANEQQADAQVVNASRDLARYRELEASAPAAVARQQMDQAEAAARSGSGRAGRDGLFPPPRRR